jgi:hypothetical protein
MNRSYVLTKNGKFKRRVNAPSPEAALVKINGDKMGWLATLAQPVKKKKKHHPALVRG